jgi:hypothetical protein
MHGTPEAKANAFHLSKKPTPLAKTTLALFNGDLGQFLDLFISFLQNRGITAITFLTQSCVDPASEALLHSL